MELNAYAPDFELPSVTGEVVHLTRYLEKHRAVVVVFMCNHCPYVKAYIDRLKEIQRDYQPQGVTLIGINANNDTKYPEDSFAKMKEYSQTWGLNFPYLRDHTQEVTQDFGATCTPEPFLLDQTGCLRYRGAIDDNYRDPAGVTRQDLRLAIDAVLNGQPVPTTTNKAVGCSVKWAG
ncbi:MAG: thioredoxin family protein [Pseudanabaenaceae cyanobacterium]|jgi:peroxiredoxin